MTYRTGKSPSNSNWDTKRPENMAYVGNSAQTQETGWFFRSLVRLPLPTVGRGAFSHSDTDTTQSEWMLIAQIHWTKYGPIHYQLICGYSVPEGSLMLSSSFPVSEHDKHAGGELVFNRSTLPMVCPFLPWNSSAAYSKNNVLLNFVDDKLQSYQIWMSCYIFIDDKLQSFKYEYQMFSLNNWNSWFERKNPSEELLPVLNSFHTLIWVLQSLFMACCISIFKAEWE